MKAGEVPSLDGVDSPLSRSIQAKHQLYDFEMNSNWIGSSQDWTCPCCARSKFQISRVGKRKILANLVVHHDHIVKALKLSFHEAFEAAGTNVEQTRGALLVKRIGTAFSAYEEVLICVDCNNADGAAKKEAGCPGSFSFSIGQIKRFIRCADHRSHEIDKVVCKQVWQEAQPAYELRMKIIREVAHAAATDTHWYEPYERGMTAIPVLGTSQRFGDRDILQWVSLEELIHALSPAPSPEAPDRSGWRTPPAPRRGRRLPGNFLAMLRTAGHGKDWNSVPDDWRCPVCRRTKYEVTYVSQDGEVTFSLRTNGGQGPWAQAKAVCNHCGDTLIKLKFEVQDLIGRKLEDTYALATPDELTQLIIPRPHTAHEIRPDLARQLVDTCQNRLMSEP